jgi:uncharacterized protein (DUF58 family)
VIVSGPMPTHFRWLWYLVGLAGLTLAVVGVIGILGSALDNGILIPMVVVGAIVIGYVIVRFRRSLDAALAAAPSRQLDATPVSDGSEAPAPVSAAGGPRDDQATAPAVAKPTANPGRTSRR